MPSLPSETIRLRGAAQNNLKGIDLDIPLRRLTVVTGLSGAGKSSLVFDTLHAEGQRRYVETFSAYTRQFLELLHRPKVASVENIRPSIAIEQTNTVKTSRSTVGTMTELCDYFKSWFPQVAELIDPATGRPVVDHHPRALWTMVSAEHAGESLLLGLPVHRPASVPWAEVLAGVAAQGFIRAWAGGSLRRIGELAPEHLPEGEAELLVVLDRIEVSPAQAERFLEGAETALRLGGGELRLLRPDGAVVGRYRRGRYSPATGRRFRDPVPAMFSFNHPMGACPRCRGFGRVVEIDLRLAVPDLTRSIDGGAIVAFQGKVYSESLKDLRRWAPGAGVRTDVPYGQLTARERAWVEEGDPSYRPQPDQWPDRWYGLKGFFRWLETQAYKMHVRVFLSHFRSYQPCPDCSGSRLQPEALLWRWQGLTLPELYGMPVCDLRARLQSAEAGTALGAPGSPATLARQAILSRLAYLEQVGLGYLTLDRQSRTLSGGEVERVNLTACLGTSLVDTLFVLDEPSVGLHPRDIDQLVSVLRRLVAQGNTVVVVEHDEAVIRAADWLVEIGPEPGARGGHLVAAGKPAQISANSASLTGAYLSGRRRVPAPRTRRPIAGAPCLVFRGAERHNLRGVDVSLPLGRLVCLAGVSGSGKSTLLDSVIHQGLLQSRGRAVESPARLLRIEGADRVGEIVRVDQSPVSRTPRSNPALFTGAWEGIRRCYARSPEAAAAGFTASHFSFNAGDGRCPHCRGLGYERVEMQFLADVFVPCPVCDTLRFRPEVLAIKVGGRTIADLLSLTVDEAAAAFSGEPEIARRLGALQRVGLGYLGLGQPLSTLSGGESQRLKLVRHLTGVVAVADEEEAPEDAEPRAEPSGGPAEFRTGAPGALLLLDEPTTGLHFEDIARLLGVLHELVDRGHSVVVVEHNMEVLQAADWIIEVGPEAGEGGGRIVAAGPPEHLAAETSATAPFLRRRLAVHPAAPPAPAEIPGAPDAAAPSLPPGPRELRVLGARENNLRDLSVSIPHGQLTVVTGVSGSGKSTLAFDIVFAEGQRRFMESMSAYARQFVEQLPRPDLDGLEGIPPAVAIEQRINRGSRKSTVATITEVAQYLRLLYARLGVQHHPETGRPVLPLPPAALRRLLDATLRTAAARRARAWHLCAPLARRRKGHHEPLARWIREHGYPLLRADGKLLAPAAFQKLDRFSEHDIEAVVADLRQPGIHRGDALEEALRLGHGACFLCEERGRVVRWFSTTRTDPETGESFPELDPKDFSWNSPKGWCPACRGHGRIYPWMRAEPGEDRDGVPPEIAELLVPAEDDEASHGGELCRLCQGERLNRVSRSVRLPLRGLPGISLPALLRLRPAEVLARLRRLDLDARGRLIAADLVAQIEERLRFLGEVGLDYLSLDRPTETLSGGEAQRIRLAAQLGTNLTGVLYVLDEPSIGLHARDNDRLIRTLLRLRDKGNTVLVVEHDDAVMAAADHIIDLGPGAGVHGGRLLAAGNFAAIQAAEASLTGQYLARGIPHPIRGSYRPLPPPPPKPHATPARRSPRSTPRAPGGAASDGWLELLGVRFRNLRGCDLRLPLGRLTVVSGVSGAGKSTLVSDVLRPAVAAACQAGRSTLTGSAFLRTSPWKPDDPAPGAAPPPPPFATLRGAGGFRTVVEVDQQPIGKTPRSTPATYLGAFDLIRQCFATLPEARMRGWSAGRFSFNVAGGRCENCSGAGRVKLEMNFLPETFVPCDACRGHRYGPEIGEVRWRGRSISEILELSFEEAAAFFSFHTQLRDMMGLMVECGLGYLRLGQSSPTLSGGEAQRLKLASELVHGLQSFSERRRGTPPRNLYILEEPTIGLHLSDVEKLIRLLHRLVDQGHTVVVIEHDLDILAEADHLVEMGPEGGPGGGRILYQGPVSGLARCRSSRTAPFLTPRLAPR